MIVARNLYVIPSFMDEAHDLYVDSRCRRTEPTEYDNITGIAMEYLSRTNFKQREEK